jgi:hypothetical protein
MSALVLVLGVWPLRQIFESLGITH